MKDIKENIFGEDKLVKKYNHFLDIVCSTADLAFSVSVAILPPKEQLIIKVRITKTVRWNFVISSLSGKEYINEKMPLTKGENIVLKKYLGEYDVPKNIIITDEEEKLILYRVLVC